MVDTNATRLCVVCGAAFVRDGKRIFCSNECKKVREAQVKRQSAILHGHINGEQSLTCKNCSISFVGTSNTAYCSAKCKNNWRNLCSPKGNRDVERRRASNKRTRDKSRSNGNRDRTSDRLRLQRLRSCTGYLSQKDIAAVKAEFDRCPYCGADILERHIDHMDALSIGGAHDLSNLVVCCARCNLMKGDMPFIDWLSKVDSNKRASVVKLYERKHGATMYQRSLFGPVIVRDPVAQKQHVPRA